MNISHLKALQCDVFFCEHVRYTERVVRSEVGKQVLVLRLAILFYWFTVFFIFFSGWKCLECALFVHHIIYFCQTFIIFLSSSWQVFIAREQICLKRLGISNTQCCRTPSYKSEVKRKRSSVRLVELLKLESIKGEKKGLRVYFLSTEIPVYTLLLALGVRSDSRDASIVTIFVMLMRNVSIFWGRTEHFHMWINCKKRPQIPAKESVQDCIFTYLFPGLNSSRHKPRFLGYMVKSLLQATENVTGEEKNGKIN